MLALIILCCYAIGSFLSYLLTNYICGYRGYDDDAREINTIITLMIWPVQLPSLLLFPYFSAAGKWIAGLGERSAAKAAEHKENVRLNKLKRVTIDEPTSYRTSERVEKFVRASDDI